MWKELAVKIQIRDRLKACKSSYFNFSLFNICIIFLTTYCCTSHRIYLNFLETICHISDIQLHLCHISDKL